MQFNKALVAGKLRRWEKYLEEYRLPFWEDIPDFGLYMDQVVTLLKGYLDYLPPELKEEQFITPATINNYVRKKIMPEPVKKKYYRSHIAYLIMICTLKHGLSIATLQSIIPHPLPPEELETRYNAYVRRHRLTAKYFLEAVRNIAGGILDHEQESEYTTDDPADLIVSSAVASAFARLLAEKLLLLEGRDLTNGGSIELSRREREHKET